MRRRFVLAGLATVSALLVAACSGRPARHDNDVHLGMTSDPASLSLVGRTDVNSAQIASLVSDGLVAYDARMRYVPMVARSWELAQDGKSVTFHLRDGVFWHDGSRLTSRDVAFTAAKIRDPKTQAQSWVTAFDSIAAVETPDDRTVIVRYAHPYADALEPWRVPLLPEHAASNDPNFLSSAFAQHPVGCGPFRFVSHDPGQSVVLEAFEGYWGGRPNVDRLVFKIVKAERTAYEALLMGDLDVLGVTPDLWRDALTSAAAARLARLVYYRLNGWKVDWNQDGSNPFFQDVRVRRALLLALDRKRFAATAARGLARPGVSSYPPECPWTEPSIAALPFDPRESQRLLDEAGWRIPAGRRVREKDGMPFSFTMLLNSGPQEIADRIAAWMQQSLAEVGVDMKIEKLEWEAFRERRKSHRFEAAMGSVSFDATPDRFDLYHGSAPAGEYNYGSFADHEVDLLLEEGLRVVDPVARRAIYDRLQRRLDDLQPISFLFQLATPVLHDAELEGIQTSPVGIYQFAPGPRAWHWSNARMRP